MGFERKLRKWAKEPERWDKMRRRGPNGLLRRLVADPTVVLAGTRRCSHMSFDPLAHFCRLRDGVPELALVP